MPKPNLSKDDATIADKVIRKVCGVPEEGKGKVANLPMVSSLFRNTEEMNSAIAVLETGHRLKDVVDAATAELVGVKDEVTAIVLGADVPGYRYGTMAASVNLIPGRKTLNKDKLRGLLLDEGVDPTRVSDIIEKAHAEGEPYYRVEFRKLV